MLTSGMCATWKLESLEGVHQPGDVYKIALIREGATKSYGPETKNYAELGEDEVPTGDGYQRGGKTLSGRKALLEGKAAMVTWESPLWENASIAASGAVLYNASRNNRAVAVLAFKKVYRSTDGPFRINLPPAEVGKAIVRIE